MRRRNHIAQAAERFDGRPNHGQDFADRIRKALRAAHRLHVERLCGGEELGHEVIQPGQHIA